jgi:hypothetical protein
MSKSKENYTAIATLGVVFGTVAATGGAIAGASFIQSGGYAAEGAALNTLFATGVAMLTPFSQKWRMSLAALTMGAGTLFSGMTFSMTVNAMEQKPPSVAAGMVPLASPELNR